MPRIFVTGETLSRKESAKGTLISAKPDKIAARNKKIRLSIGSSPFLSD
jgi:hypothetical protein